MENLKPLTYEEKFNIVGGAGLSGAFLGAIGSIIKETFAGITNLFGAISASILAHKSPKTNNFSVTMGNAKFENKPPIAPTPAKQPVKAVEAPHQWVSDSIL